MFLGRKGKIGVSVSVFVLTLSIVTSNFSYAASSSKKAKDFSAFACNPNDSRLKSLIIPSNLSLEAQASAACVALAYIQNPKSRSKINIRLSPKFQENFYSTLNRSVSAADRIFGHFGYKDFQTIEILGSDDPAWMCENGRKLWADRSEINWEKMPDSGCGDNLQYRSRADVIDAGKTPMLWFLVRPEQRLERPTGKYRTWPDSLQQFGHELAHSTMFQLSNFSETRFVEHPGGWYPEGQAQYLDLTISWLEFKNKAWRDVLLASAKRDAGIYFPKKAISFKALSDPDIDFGQAIYSLGGLASEYLIAHYGLKKTFDWYSTWSAPGCPFPNTQSCWIERADETFGLTPEELFNRLDKYVNNELKIRYKTTPIINQPNESENCLGEILPKNTIKKKSTGLSIADTARNCVIYHLLSNQTSNSKAIEVVSDIKVSTAIENRAIGEVNLGLKFYQSLLSDPNTKIKIIFATNPDWLCKYLTSELTGSNKEDIFRTLKGSGCPGTTIAGGHSWDGWQKASCSELYGKVNLPFFAIVKGQATAYILLSRCAADLQITSTGNLNITRKLAQSLFSQVGGFGFRRYLFESGWQEIISQYGQTITFENSAYLYPESVTKAAISSSEDKEFLLGLNGKYTPISKLPDAPADYPNFNFWKVQSDIAAEYLIGTYGVPKSLELLVAWERSKSMIERSDATKAVIGLSEDELFSKIDLYIIERLK